MTTQTPTPSQIEKAKVQLSRRARWALVRNKTTGVEFIVVPSFDRQRAYYVRKDGAGCSCKAYQEYGYAVCSHMLSVRMANEQDALAAAREPSQPDKPQDDDQSPVDRYRELIGVCAVTTCDEDRVKGGRYCSRHALVDAF